MKRRNLLIAAAALPLLSRSATPQSSVDKEAVLQLRRMQAALGGVDRLKVVRDLDWTVLAKTWNASGAAAPDTIRRIRWLRPNFFRKDQRAGKLFVIEFFDGTGGWEVVPDAGFQTLRGEELQIVRKEARGFLLNLWLSDHDPDFQVTSSRKGTIRIASADVGVDMILDPKSGLPTQTSGVRSSASGTVTGSYRQVRQRSEILEWQNIDGLQWPLRTVNMHDDIKRAEIATTSIRINTGFSATVLSDRTPAV